MAKRINRNRRLTSEEAAKYKRVRDQIAEELPDLVKRHGERAASKDTTEGKKASPDEQQA